MKDLDAIRQKLINLLLEHKSSFRVTSNSPDKFEVTGTIPTMQGKKKVDGFYFASVIPKPKDVRFYFFPVYTHKEQIGELPENLRKALKGKSCFHIRSIDEEFESNLKSLIDTSVELYRQDGLVK